MKIKFVSILILFLALLNPTEAKISTLVQRVEPTNWWTNMTQPEFQLMIYGTNISLAEIKIDYPGIAVTRKEKTDNPNYVFLYLNILKNTKPGYVKIQIKQGKKKQTVLYELKNRQKDSSQRQSFTESDAIYLLMPDRFANGNTDNDSVKGYHQGVHREIPGDRHGGDIDGIISKIPYLADL